jgi:hypothetical protein
MPRLRNECHGRIVEVPEVGAIEEDGLEAVLLPPVREPGEVVVEWELGSEACPRWSFRGWLPFFLEGPDAEVRALQALLPTEDTP